MLLFQYMFENENFGISNLWLVLNSIIIKYRMNNKNVLHEKYLK